MISLLISLVLGAASGVFFARDLDSAGWGVFCGLAVFMLSQLAIGLTLRRKINAKQSGLQRMMEEANTRINRQITLFQQRQPGNVSGVRQLAERLQNESARKMLAELESFRPFYKWSMLLYRQIDAMKAQLYYQLHDYTETDRYLKTAMMGDSQTIAIRLARMYKHNDPKLDAFYRKKCASLKGESGAFVASVYAWIKLHRQENDRAVAALVAARKRSDHPVLVENLEHLVNGKFKQFSNAGFGALWYALELEEYKIKPQRMKQPRPF